MITEAKRTAMHRKVDLLVQQMANGRQGDDPASQSERLTPYFYDIFDTLLDEAHELQMRKAETSELRELIVEIREGFRRMDERFEQVDKRFEQMQLDMNRRFEQVDKRFEQVDKRFEQVDKQFERVDGRFGRIYQFMMWMMGLIATGFFGLYLKLFFLK